MSLQQVGNPSITYRSREDATAETERALLGAAYAYLLIKRKNVEPAPEPDVRDGNQVQGEDSADEGSIPE